MKAFLKNMFSNSSKKQELELKVPVIVLSSGFGLRMRPLTGNLFPKLLCTIGQKTLFNQMVENITPICSKLYVISTSKDLAIIKKWFDQNCEAPFQMECFEYHDFAGSWDAIQKFGIAHPEISKCIIHWSDITAPLNTRALTNNNDKNVIVYCSDLNIKCRFGIDSEGIISMGSKYGNVIGIYGVKNLQKLVNQKFTEDFIIPDFANILEYMQTKTNTPILIPSYIKSKNIIDNGDMEKHALIMEQSSNQVRYFNDISFLADRVIKTANCPRGVQVMKKEIEFYTKLGELCGTVLPKIYKTRIEENFAQIEMELLPGETVHELLSSGEHPNYKIIKAVFEALTTIHNIDQEMIGCEPAILEEYVDTIFSRVQEIEMLIPRSKNVVCLLTVYNPYIFSKETVEVDTSNEMLEKLVQSFVNVLKQTKFIKCIIHGDPNSKNMVGQHTPDGYKIKLIDPRGKFGSWSLVGERTYDYAKFIYGCHAYSHFNHAKDCTIKYDRIGLREVVEFDMTQFIDICIDKLVEYVYHYHSAFDDDRKYLITAWYTTMLGMIFLKLTGYIKNDPTKALYAYMYGIYLMDKGLEPLKKYLEINKTIELFI